MYPLAKAQTRACSYVAKTTTAASRIEYNL